MELCLWGEEMLNSIPYGNLRPKLPKTCKRCREDLETNDSKQETHLTVDTCIGILIAVGRNHRIKMMDELEVVKKTILQVTEIVNQRTKERDDLKASNIVLRAQVEKVKREADGHMDSVQESFRKEREALLAKIKELEDYATGVIRD